jgi:hypothetical protein
MADTPPVGSTWQIPEMGQFATTPYNQTYGGQQAPYPNIQAQIADTMMMSQLLPGYPKNPMSFAPNSQGQIVGAPNGAGRYSFGGGGGTFDGNYGLLGGGSPAGSRLAPGAGGPPGMNGGFRNYTGGASMPTVTGAPQGAPQGQNPTMSAPGQSGPFNNPGFTQSTAGYSAPTTPAPPGAMQAFYASRNPNVGQGGLLNMFGGDQTKMNQYINQAQFANPAAMAQADRANGLSTPAPFAQAIYQAQGKGTIGPNGQWTWNPGYAPKGN